MKYDILLYTIECADNDDFTNSWIMDDSTFVTEEDAKKKIEEYHFEFIKTRIISCKKELEFDDSVFKFEFAKKGE